MTNEKLHTSHDVIGATQAAHILGLSRRAVIDRINAGTLTATTKLPGRTGSYLFDRAYIEEIAQREDALAASVSQGVA